MSQNYSTVGGFGYDVGLIDENETLANVLDTLEEDDRVEVVWYGDGVLGEDMGVILCVPGTDFDVSSRDYDREEQKPSATPGKVGGFIDALQEVGLVMGHKSPEFVTGEYFG